MTNLALRSPLTTWLGTLALAAVVGWLFAAEIEWLLNVELAGNDGRFMALYLGVALALHLISAGGRAYASYGLAVAPGWERLTLAMFLVAAIASVALLASGGMGVAVDGSIVDVLDDAVSALWVAGATAYLQEICFRGFLFTEVKRGLGGGRLAAIAAGTLAALAFALTISFDPSRYAGMTGAWPVFLTLFLFGGLLQMMRLVHRTLVAPIGLAAGWLFVEAMARRGAIQVGASSDFPGSILEPGFVQPAPALWAVLVAAFAGYAFLLTLDEATRERWVPAVDHRRRHGIAARIKRLVLQYNPFTNVFALARFDVWLRILVLARFRVMPFYWPRLLVSLAVSAFVTVINLPERLLAPMLLRRRTVAPPVFVVGLHRSGTTLLHTLLSLDKQFAAPRLAHVMNPDGFLVFGRPLFFLFMPLMPWQRPMDAVTFSAHEPQEDEFAIACRSGLSPYWTGVFPRLHRELDRYIYTEEMSPAEQAAFVDDIRTLLVKMDGWRERVPLLKSPYHAARVTLLARAFPGARFVYIRRNPTSVYLSSRGVDDFYAMLQVQSPEPGRTFADRLLEEHFTKVEEACATALAGVPAGHKTSVAFEDLIADPTAEIERMYAELGLTYSQEARTELAAYLEKHAGYRRNVHPPLTPQLARRLSTKLAPAYDKGGYSRPIDTPATR